MSPVISGVGQGPTTRDMDLDKLEAIFGSDRFVNMMHGMVKSLNPFQGGLDKIAKSIFPKIIGGMFKMILVMALLEPLSGMIEGFMVFMEPLAPVLEAFGTLLGTSLLPLTTWLAEQLMHLMPYITGLTEMLTALIDAFTKLINWIKDTISTALTDTIVKNAEWRASQTFSSNAEAGWFLGSSPVTGSYLGG